MKRIIKLIIWIIFIVFIIFYINYKNFTYFKIEESKNITIEKGDTLLNALPQNLGISKFYFRIYLLLNSDKKINIQSGQYRLLKGENLESIIKTIDYGSLNSDKKITILEGWNIYDIDDYLTQLGLINTKEFIGEAKKIEKYKKQYSFLENAITLEGFLYPDTYFIKKDGFNIEELNHKMLTNFREKVYNNLLSTLKKEQIIEVLTFASIVEKEAFSKGGPEEKAIIAGILKKRYKEKWMIGADITACYAFNLNSRDCKMNLSKYINDKNDYNTRAMVGLPKTPINNPSFSSINSVINSKETTYYYYLHDNKGEIHYGRTNEEHINNKNNFLEFKN